MPVSFSFYTFCLLGEPSLELSDPGPAWWLSTLGTPLRLMPGFFSGLSLMAT